ncbi:tetratricopeptide repeat protein [Echinicola sp. 20G]|uniref:tetratricopeptide repeat protein n=1 Tax=Echinicola sp. 20G TaxID=2781961 RepID=UPI0019106D26|nr:tetratricopeptide repeat protein [Echinicola sp. 20G]
MKFDFKFIRTWSLISFFLVWTICFSFGQEPFQSKQDSLFDLTNTYLDEGKYQEANQVLLPLLQDRKWINNLTNKRKVTNNLGFSYYYLGQYDSSNHFYILTNQAATELKDTVKIISSFKSIAMSYRRMGLYSKSLESSQKALEVAKIKKDTGSASEILNTIGLMYIDLGENELAAKSHRESLALALAIGDSTMEAYAYNNLAMAYRKLNYIDSSLYYNFRSLDLKNRLSIVNTASTLTNIGLDFLKLNQLDSAQKYLEWANIVYHKNEHQIGYLVSYNNLADLFLHLGQYQIAKSYLDSGATLLHAVTLKDLLLDHYDLKVRVNEKMGQHEDALMALKKLADLKEEVFLEEKLQVQKVESRFLLRERELENEYLEQETVLAQARIRTNEQFIIFLAILVGLSIIFGLFLFRFNRKLKEKNLIIIDQKKDNEHRIYNFLTRLQQLLRLASESISDEKAKEVLRNSEAAIISIASLQEYLTYSNHEEEDVLLGKYLLDLTAHLEELFRHTGQKIDFRVEIDSNAKSTRLSVPTLLNLGLIVSEIITNASKYAFNETINYPKISVSLKRQANVILIHLEDNGIGISNEASEGLGTKLIGRLARYIQAEISLQSDVGTRYTLKLIRK